jgi:hypothetical protein
MTKSLVDVAKKAPTVINHWRCSGKGFWGTRMLLGLICIARWKWNIDVIKNLWHQVDYPPFHLMIVLRRIWKLENPVMKCMNIHYLLGEGGIYQGDNSIMILLTY